MRKIECFATNLKWLRKAKGLTQREMASLLKVSRVGYANWELGKREPSFKYLVFLADYYGVSIDYFFEERFVELDTDEEEIEVMDGETLFHERLYRLRKSFKYTQSDVGRLVGVRQAVVSKWEKGKREPRFIVLCKIAKLFDVTTDYLLGMDILESEEK